MAEVERINVEEARRKTNSGDALLVCAYDDEEKCAAIKLEGSISLAGLAARLSSGPRDQEIIFYCG
jgi:hypothetical protein